MTGGAVPPQPEEEEEGEVEAGHMEEEEEEQQQTTPVKEDTREKSASSVRRFSTPKARRESAVETEADFQCRAAIRDSPLLSYLAAVPNTPYSAALWDGNGSTCSSQVTSRSQSPATSPRRSISGAYSVCESLMSQKSVGMADLTGSKAKERLRQSLGHINLLTCLCSSWEEYLQVRTALQYLYRCLNRPLPPPTPREEALDEKSPSPLPVSDVVPDEAEAAADETVVKLTSTVNCTDTRCGTQDTMEGSAADLDGRMRSRTRNPELLAGDTDPRGEFAMRLDFSKLVLPRRGYSVPTAADAAELLKCFKGNADVAPEEEKETPPPTEEEEPVPSSEGRERVTLTPRNADLDSLFLRRWDREGKDSAMVEELKQYCAQLFAENESLRGTLSKNPLVNSSLVQVSSQLSA
ncbi:hypothetical protein ADEAN_000504200 [Angomonas deanei]|uniref:Uncharacterized protein n=1 Tax=Angomonas deanei TaxID=59799 RepID=A0A7G2CFA9_9TRYP|nr:hypothetical protein ADEAN_000504200 [Angomonas deanei]